MYSDIEILGSFSLIYQLPVEICEMFIEEIFNGESLDAIDGETLNIIRTFFENNLNLSETSRQLYVHRNTLVYRFEKIQKKFGLDLRTFEDAMTFKLAMLVSGYLRYIKLKRRLFANAKSSFFHFNSMRCSGGKYKYAGRLKSEDSRRFWSHPPENSL